MSSERMLNSNKFLAALVVMGTVFAPGTAMAFDMEYYTYGGFAEVVSAFTKCALIFSSDGYAILLPSIFCLSLMIALGGAAIYKLQTAVRDEGMTITRPEGIWSAIVNALLGSILFMSLIVPKGTLNIYDPTENAYEAVGGIPMLAVLAAGGSNLIERSVVGLMDTSGSPLGYSKQSGMKGIQVMNSLMARGDEAPKNEATLAPSLESYITDCVVWELARPGTTLSSDELKNKTVSIQTSFAKATNLGSYTTYYDPALSLQGETMTCTAAWTNIVTRIGKFTAATDDLFKETKKRACGDAGYLVYDTDATQADTAYNECITSTDALIKAIDGGWSLDKFMTEMYFSNHFWAAMSKDNPAGFANAKTSIRNMSSLQEYLSTMGQKRGLVTAFAAALLPFFALLLPTKYWPKAVTTIITAFLICPIWGLLDAMTSGFYLERAIGTWSGFLSNNWGVDQLALWNGSSIKEMSTWGLYVAASFGIALSSARVIGGSLGSVVGGFGGIGAANSEGALDKGRIGTGAMNRESVATGSGLANATTMGANGYALSQAMPNWDGGNQVSFKTGQEKGDMNWKSKALNEYGGKGVENGYSDSGESGFLKGAASMEPLKAIKQITGTDSLMDAAKSNALASVNFSGKDAKGILTSNTATVDPNNPANANITSKGAPRTTTDGVTLSSDSTGNTTAGSSTTQVASHGNSATVTTISSPWADRDVKALEEGFQKLPANATQAQYQAFAGVHGIGNGGSGGWAQAKALHQNYMAIQQQNAEAVVQAEGNEASRTLSPKQAEKATQALSAMPAGQAPEAYQAALKKEGIQVTPEQATAMASTAQRPAGATAPVTPEQRQQRIVDAHKNAIPQTSQQLTPEQTEKATQVLDGMQGGRHSVAEYQQALGQVGVQATTGQTAAMVTAAHRPAGSKPISPEQRQQQVADAFKAEGKEASRPLSVKQAEKADKALSSMKPGQDAAAYQKALKDQGIQVTPQQAMAMAASAHQSNEPTAPATPEQRQKQVGEAFKSSAPKAITDPKKQAELVEGLKSLPANATPEQYAAFAKQQGISTDQAERMHQNMKAANQQSLPGLTAAVRSTGPRRAITVDNVKLANAQDTGTVGKRKSRSEVAATEIAAKMDKNKLFSNTDGYLKSIGWTEAQTTAFKQAWRKQTGYEIGESVSQRKSTSENKGTTTRASATVSAGASVTGAAKVEVGTPKFLPVSAESSVTTEGHIGIEAQVGIDKSKSLTTQNGVDRSITGGSKDSTSTSNDKEIARALATTIAESKDSRYAESLSQGLGLSESSKAAISDTREDSIGAGTTTNLSTYMVNDLLAKDTRFQTGDTDADTARAMKFLDGNSEESKEYKEKARGQFMNEYEVSQNVEASVDRAQEVLHVEEKHDQGPPVERIKQLENEAGNLDKKVPEIVGPGVGVGPHAGDLTSGRSTAPGSPRRTSKSMPKVDVPNNSPAPNVPGSNVKLKIAMLSQNADKTEKDMTFLPRLGKGVPAPPEVGTKINVPGQDLYQPRPGEPKKKRTQSPYL